jgi:transposase
MQEKVLEVLQQAPVKCLDESGMRICGSTQWLHVMADTFHTYYRASPKRGEMFEGVSGIIVHDHWKPYFNMDGVDHALCNAHHLRELKSLMEIEKEAWAFKMTKLLRILCKLAKKSTLKEELLQRIVCLYHRIIKEGLSYHEGLPALQGRKKRQGHNLLIRLFKHHEEVLRFASVAAVPFTNNQAEQDIRMMKVKQGISGCFRSQRGAEIFCTIRGHLSTQRKKGKPIFDGILDTV